MRWLLIGFLVSLGALLLAVAGVARHIRLQRKKGKGDLPTSLEPAEESDLELKPR